MAKANFVQDGNSIDYTPAQDVTGGDVVVLSDSMMVGIAKVDIPAGTQGSLATTGVFDFPKTAGAGTAIPAGTRCLWNPNTSIAFAGDSPPVGMTMLGWCVRDAGDDDTTVRIRLQQ